MKIKTILIVTSLVLTACGTPAKKHAFDNQIISNKNYDKTWERVIEYFARNNIPIKNVAKDSGIVVAETLAFTDDYADCGTPGLDQRFAKLGTFNVFVKVEAKPSVTVNATFDETRINGWDGRHYKTPCYSKGKIEREILNYVNQ